MSTVTLPLAQTEITGWQDFFSVYNWLVIIWGSVTLIGLVYLYKAVKLWMAKPITPRHYMHVGRAATLPTGPLPYCTICAGTHFSSYHEESATW